MERHRVLLAVAVINFEPLSKGWQRKVTTIHFFAKYYYYTNKQASILWEKRITTFIFNLFLLKNDSIGNFEGFLALKTQISTSDLSSHEEITAVNTSKRPLFLCYVVGRLKIGTKTEKSLLDLKVKSSLLLIAVLTAMIQIRERRNN